MFKNKKGFTLIELLIVIVIIGILVAVLIAVINPARARGRARDAGIQSSMNKVALNAQGFMSAYGAYPTCDEMAADISGTISGIDGGSGPTCTFGFESIDASDTNWTYYFDNGDPLVTDDEYFYITRLSEGLGNGTLFVYHSSKSGQIYECANGTTGTLEDKVWAVDTDNCKSVTSR